MADGSYLPDGTMLYRWNGASYNIYEWVDTATGWDPNGDPTLNPGEGVNLRNNSANPLTVTFVGLVPEGNLVNALPGGQQSLVSSKVPLAGGIQSVLNYPPQPSDMVYIHDGNSFTAYIFDDIDLAWSPGEPVLGVGESCFITPSSARLWTRDFSITCP
jgi:hypothetical protein